MLGLCSPMPLLIRNSSHPERKAEWVEKKKGQDWTDEMGEDVGDIELVYSDF